MSNVNNLNGIPNFGHGEEEEVVIPTQVETPALDDSALPVETDDKADVKSKKSKRQN